jgi:hypothetical protein
MKALQHKNPFFCVINVSWNLVDPTHNLAILSLINISNFIVLALP